VESNLRLRLGPQGLLTLINNSFVERMTFIEEDIATVL